MTTWTPGKPLKPDQVAYLVSHHARARVFGPEGVERYLQPIMGRTVEPDGWAWTVLLSTRFASSVVELVPGELGLYRLADGEVDPVDPLKLDTLDEVLAKRDGHNGIAEAVALFAWLLQPARFAYRKGGKVAVEQRHARVERVDGPRFVGRDYARSHDRRTFRLDWIDSVQLSELAHLCPFWTYEAGWQAGSARGQL